MRQAPSRRRRLWFGVVAVLLVIVVSFGILAAADVYLHARTQDLAAVNVWGYRGAPVPAKHDDEFRFVMLGGSTAFGYGLPSHESIPAFLERALNAKAGPGRRFRVVNLGAPGEGAYGFRFNLEDYAYLEYDAAILYEGYNDLGEDGVPAGVPSRGAPNYLLWRRQSPVFQMTGYYPILPLVLREKAMAMMYGGDLNAAYGGVPVVFQPGLATRATAGALTAAAGVGEAIERQVGRLTAGAERMVTVDENCVARWRQYCGAVRDAVEWALARGTRVLFVSQPYVSDAHVEQQANAAAMLRARFGDRITHVDTGRVIDMRDRSLVYDGLHLVAEGNARIAEALLPHALEAAR